LQEYIENNLVTEIIKDDNWRCSETVIELLNKIRIDDIKQERKRRDDEAGKNLSGSVKFIYSNADEIDFVGMKKHKVFDNWDFDVKETKENNICYKCCASNSHKSRDCSVTISCKECGSKQHTTALHVIKASPQPRPYSSSHQPFYGFHPEASTFI
jgi:DNA helicase-2/ATP-dependent DNA helicase PcrA